MITFKNFFRLAALGLLAAPLHAASSGKPFSLKTHFDVDVPQEALVVAAPSQHLITMNCHGAHRTEMIQIPANVYVLAPHPDGFDALYTVVHLTYSFEGLMFTKAGEFTGLAPVTSGGFRLYRPGQEIQNLKLSPWGAGEFAKWAPRHKGEVALKESYEADHGKPMKFWPQGTNYKTTKIKYFERGHLATVLAFLAERASEENPQVLIPFCCNNVAGKPAQSISAPKKK